MSNRPILNIINIPKASSEHSAMLHFTTATKVQKDPISVSEPHSPDVPFGIPNKRLRGKPSSDPESPVSSKLQPYGNLSETAALPEQVPSAPEQENVTNRKEEAKKRAEKRAALPPSTISRSQSSEGQLEAIA